jgi:formate/nitrite transporter FocA (FNT family)
MYCIIIRNTTLHEKASSTIFFIMTFAIIGYETHIQQISLHPTIIKECQLAMFEAYK